MFSRTRQRGSTIRSYRSALGSRALGQAPEPVDAPRADRHLSLLPPSSFVWSALPLGVPSVTLCVPSGEGAAITTPTKGSCGSGTSVQLSSEAKEQEKLLSILPHINYEAEGVDKHPTIQFSGVNLQVINGSGSESISNGTGNLILGYDEKPGAQTGSHNLLLGGTGNSYTSYGGIVGGFSDKISGGYASILGGTSNTASGFASTITGGTSNKTTTNYATISGGCSNLAGSGTISISSFCTEITHVGYFPSILGGAGNQAEAQNSPSPAARSTSPTTSTPRSRVVVTTSSPPPAKPSLSPQASPVIPVARSTPLSAVAAAGKPPLPMPR
jgi:hypothetical protein